MYSCQNVKNGDIIINFKTINGLHPNFINPFFNSNALHSRGVWLNLRHPSYIVIWLKKFRDTDIWLLKKEEYVLIFLTTLSLYLDTFIEIASKVRRCLLNQTSSSQIEVHYDKLFSDPELLFI